jgi:hypothetical protein
LDWIGGLSAGAGSGTGLPAAGYDHHQFSSVRGVALSSSSIPFFSLSIALCFLFLLSIVLFPSVISRFLDSSSLMSHSLSLSHSHSHSVAAPAASSPAAVSVSVSPVPHFDVHASSPLLLSGPSVSFRSLLLTWLKRTHDYFHDFLDT